jgi:hypothetical protein
MLVEGRKIRTFARDLGHRELPKYQLYVLLSPTLARVVMNFTGPTLELPTMNLEF